MADFSYSFFSAAQLARAVDELVAEISGGLPQGGKKRLKNLQRGYSKLPTMEREAFRTDHPDQYHRWVRNTGRPKPQLVAVQTELFDQATLTCGRTVPTLEERMARWTR